MKQRQETEEEKYLKVVTAEGFRVLGYSFKDLLKLTKYLKTKNITLDKLLEDKLTPPKTDN